MTRPRHRPHNGSTDTRSTDPPRYRLMVRWPGEPQGSGIPSHLAQSGMSWEQARAKYALAMAVEYRSQDPFQLVYSVEQVPA